MFGLIPKNKYSKKSVCPENMINYIIIGVDSFWSLKNRKDVALQ